MWQRRLREVVHEEQGFSGFQVGLKKEKAIIIPQGIHMKLHIQLFKPHGKNYFNLQKCTYTYA